MTVHYIPGNAIRELADYVFQRYHIIVPPAVSFEDLFKPITWAHHAGRLKQYDIVRVCANDGAYDVDLTVLSVENGGVQMGVRPHMGGLIAEKAIEVAATRAKEATVTKVPIEADGLPKVRVQFLPATKWRVLGMTGVVSQDHPSEKAAIKAMNEYLRSNGLEMPKLAPDNKKDVA